MIKTLCLTALACATLAAPAFAGADLEYPVARPNYPFQRSYLTRRLVVIPPYRHLFLVRIFTTPQREPYYNVPPYAVITPY